MPGHAEDWGDGEVLISCPAALAGPRLSGPSQDGPTRRRRRRSQLPSTVPSVPCWPVHRASWGALELGGHPSNTREGGTSSIGLAPTPRLPFRAGRRVGGLKMMGDGSVCWRALSSFSPPAPWSVAPVGLTFGACRGTNAISHLLRTPRRRQVGSWLAFIWITCASIPLPLPLPLSSSFQIKGLAFMSRPRQTSTPPALAAETSRDTVHCRPR